MDKISLEQLEGMQKELFKKQCDLDIQKAMVRHFIKNKKAEQLLLHDVSRSKCVKILDQGNGACGLISDEVLEHYKKENYLEEGDQLYECKLIKTY